MFSLPFLHEVIYTHSSLQNLYARSSVLSVISNWPETHSFSLQALGGYKRLLDVLDLAASESLSCSFYPNTRLAHSMKRSSSFNNNSTALSAESRTSMEMLRNKLQALLAEELTSSPFLSKPETSQGLVKGKDEDNKKGFSQSFAYRMCLECLQHLRQSTSLNVHWASGFSITSDGVLQLDESLQDKRKKKPNVLLGYWLLDLLLEHKECHQYVADNFYTDIYDALLCYVSARTTPSKGRMFSLLTRLLEDFGGLPPKRSTRAQEWKILFRQMKQLLVKEKSGNSPLKSACLQRLIELMMVHSKYAGKYEDNVTEETTTWDVDFSRNEADGDLIDTDNSSFEQLTYTARVMTVFHLRQVSLYVAYEAFNINSIH